MSKVNDPIIINGITVKNRLTMAPTVKFDMAGEDGLVTPEHVRHYHDRAKGGFGLICVEATAVTSDGRFAPNHLGLWDDSQMDGHKQITEACHNECCCSDTVKSYRQHSQPDVWTGKGSVCCRYMER